jgi:hypothetical protein
MDKRSRSSSDDLASSEEERPQNEESNPDEDEEEDQGELEAVTRQTETKMKMMNTISPQMHPLAPVTDTDVISSNFIFPAVHLFVEISILLILFHIVMPLARAFRF